MREEVEALRAELNTVRSNEWQRAQRIFDQMCGLCEVTGPRKEKMVPRSCRVCGFYGHTKQFCPVHMARKAQMTERELALDKARGYRTPQSLAECPGGPEQWAWICKLRHIKEHVAEGERRGLGICERPRVITCAGDIVLGCTCAGCVEWDEWIASRPPTPIT